MSITMAYSKNGKEINLPKVGRKIIPAGAMVCKSGEWETVAETVMVVRTSKWDTGSQSHIKKEEVHNVGL